MTTEERIRERLREEYGITTPQELMRAIRRQKKLDIAPFVVPVNERKEKETA